MGKLQNGNLEEGKQETAQPQNNEVLETQSDSGNETEDTNYYIDDFNTQIEELNADFLPSPMELIQIILNKYNLTGNALEISYEIRNFQNYTSLLYVIHFLKEKHNIIDNVITIMEYAITDKLTKSNNLDKIQPSINIFNNFNNIFLTRLYPFLELE